MLSHRTSIVAVAASMMTSACVVGPNFKAPPPPPVSQYRAQPPHTTEATPGVPGGAAQRFVSGGDIPADWWTLFHSKALNALIAQALARNADLKAAQAALLVAHENTRAQRGACAAAGRRRNRRHAREGPLGRACSGAEQQRFSLHAGHAAAQRVLYARRLRPEQADRREPPRRRSRRPAIR